LYKAPEVRMTAAVGGGKGKKKGQYAMDVDGLAEAEEEVVRTSIVGVDGDDVEDEEPEADFPEVRLDELLEEFDEMTIGNGNAETAK
jgi:nonsense-mediated mRNA decay protein 3